MKRTIVIWANCQGHAVKSMLDLHYSHIFNTYAFSNYEFIQKNIPLPEFMYSCDIFLYQNYSKSDDVTYDLLNILNNILPEHATKISFPTLHRNYLQFCYSVESPENHLTISNDKPHGEFYYGIHNVRNEVLKMKKNGDNVSDIVEYILNNISNATYIDIEQIIKYEHDSLEFLKEKALSSDIPEIYDFIVANYKIIRLFHNVNHPNGILLNRLCNLIFKKLNLCYNENDENAKILDTLLNDWKMPIFNSILNYYGIKHFDTSCSSKINATICDINTYVTEYVNFVFNHN